MAIDPKDLGALEKALNDAAGKASVLWTTFVTFELYPADRRSTTPPSVRRRMPVSGRSFSSRGNQNGIV